MQPAWATSPSNTGTLHDDKNEDKPCLVVGTTVGVLDAECSEDICERLGETGTDDDDAIGFPMVNGLREVD